DRAPPARRPALLALGRLESDALLALGRAPRVPPDAPRPVPAALAGTGLSLGLFAIFKFALGLSLFALPAAFHG
ncbi:MAG: hypothetical protein VX181_09570, partial [Pseudomonadota bacterium]|nr:hypothetical protein [Pseudomonadota bacterium]